MYYFPQKGWLKRIFTNMGNVLLKKLGKTRFLKVQGTPSSALPKMRSMVLFRVTKNACYSKTS